MKLKTLLTLILISAAKCSFSQDTTGGTKPQVIIPLHRIKPKPKDVQVNTIETPKINAQEIPAQKPKQKHKKRTSPKL